MTNPPVTGHLRLVVDAARGLQTYQPSTRLVTTPGQPHPETQRLKQEPQFSGVPEEFKTRRNIYDDRNRNITPKEKSVEEDGETAVQSSADAVAASIESKARSQRQVRFCYGCGQDCTRVHYLRSGPEQKDIGDQNYRLCPNCFREGRHKIGDTNANFTKVEDPGYNRTADREAEWSDSETYLLLHALDTDEDDWHKIATFVGTRSAEECVQKFLQLEIEDKYIVRASQQEAAHNVPAYGRIPYTNIENPIMTVVSFLAAQSDKNVAAAAANRAVEVMKQSLQKRIEPASTPTAGDAKGRNQEGMKAENDDSMDVDAYAASKETSQAQATADNQVAVTGEVSTGDAMADLATMSLATSAARAAALASHEERQMTTLVSAALNSTLEKLELKLKQFQEMEACLQVERLELERGQQQLFLDRLAFKKRVQDVQELVRRGAMASGGGNVGVKGIPGEEDKLGFENVVVGHAEDDGKMSTIFANGMNMPTEGLKVKEI